jgi:glycosyltransferase involved in cell wall biosynthesis
MKVMHAVQGYFPALGGTEHLMQRLSESLVQDYGDRVSVLTLNTTSTEAFVGLNPFRLPTGTSAINGVTVRRFPVISRYAQPLDRVQRLAYRLRLPGNEWLRTFWSGPLSPQLLRAMDREPADIIAASSFPLLHMHYALWIGARRRLPVVLFGGLHPNDRWGFDRQTIYRAIARADQYVAYTTYERDFLIAQGIHPTKISVIGLGTDPDRFASADGQKIRERHNLGDAPVIAFIGQQGGHKGIDTLISAMPIVWQICPEARLLIAGARSQFSNYLRQLIAALGVSGQKIVMVDEFAEEEKPDYFAACDIFAYPSGHESFGIAFLEAWACRKPVIGCRIGAVASVIDEWQDGLLVPYQDTQQLASALLELLHDRDLRRTFGERGANKVNMRYSWPIVARQFRTVYEDAIARRER